MTGFRISRRCYADPPSAAFDGEGSRRRGGWTPSGKRAAYASSSLALASLEYFVKLDPEDAPPDLVSVRIDILEPIRLEYVSIDSLPNDWRTNPFPKELQAFGAAWLLAGLPVCLVVLPR